MTLPAHVLQKLSLGLESIDGIQVFLEEPEDTLSPVLESDIQCKEMDDKFDTMDNVQSELNNTIEAAEEIGAEAFTASHARLLNASLENITSKLGVTLPDVSIPSVEDYEESATSSYVASMEQADSLAKKAGQAILKLLIELKNRFIQWVKELFTNASKERARTDKLMAAGKNTKEQANKVIQVPKSFTDKASNFQMVYVKNLDDSLKVILTDIYAKFDQVVSKGGESEGEELAKIFFSHGKDIAQLGNMFTAGGMVIKQDATNWVNISFVPDAGQMVEVSNPSINDLNSMAGYLKGIGDTLIAYKNRASVRTNLIDKLTNQLKKDYSQEVDKESDEKAKKDKQKKANEEAARLVKKAFNVERAIARAGMSALVKGNTILKAGYKPQK